MSHFPTELRYSVSHEWVRDDGDHVITVGITDHAQSQLGDLVFVDLPDVNEHISAGEEVAVVESVKTAADVYSPVTGEIIAINDKLNAAPETVNQDPYGNGWLFRVKLSNLEELKALMDAAKYQATIGS